jgi:hypothetical protein
LNMAYIISTQPKVVIITWGYLLCIARARVSLLFLCSNFPAPQILSHVKLRQLVLSISVLPASPFRAIIQLLFDAATLLRVTESGMRVGRLSTM